MSDNINNEFQLAPFEEDVDTTDWATLQEEIMRQSWFQFDDYDWIGQAIMDQGAEALPGGATAVINGAQNPDPRSAAASDANPPMALSTGSEGHISAPLQMFQCPTQGCKAKPFKRRAELQRHQLIHQTDLPTFECTAIGCTRVGTKGFLRKDKLKDHMLDGHDVDTEFECFTGCGMKLLRDLMVVHSSRGFPENISLKFCRDCPMPRCSFRVNIRGKSNINDLLTHLRTKHDARGRANCAGLLLDQGYSPENVAVVCPSCETRAEFKTYDEFYRHFRDTHMSEQGWHKYLTGHSLFIGADPKRECRDWIPGEVYQHRRTLLSLWPAFEDFPVWDDIKCIKTPYKLY